MIMRLRVYAWLYVRTLVPVNAWLPIHVHLMDELSRSSTRNVAVCGESGAFFLFGGLDNACEQWSRTPYWHRKVRNMGLIPVGFDCNHCNLLVRRLACGGNTKPKG